MGIWASLCASIGGKYRYRAGPNTLGIGVENLALEQPGRTVDADFYSPRYNVRGTLAPLAPGYVQLEPFVPDNSLRGNGVYLSGDFALTGLMTENNNG